MWEEILTAAIGNGLWAVLFCVLLMYQLRDGRTRESKYRETISELVGRLELLDEVSQNVKATLAAVKKRDCVKKGKEIASEPNLRKETGCV